MTTKSSITLRAEDYLNSLFAPQISSYGVAHLVTNGHGYSRKDETGWLNE